MNFRSFLSLFPIAGLVLLCLGSCVSRKSNVVYNPGSVGLATSLGFGTRALHLPDRVQISGQDLQLNGSGVSRKYLPKSHFCGLYLEKQFPDSNQSVINADEPMAIRLLFIAGPVFREDLLAAWQPFFVPDVQDDEEIWETWHEFEGLFPHEIERGDRIDLIYVPDEGVSVVVFEEKKGTLSGLSFKKALFSVWLGDKPIEPRLRREMLGQKVM